MSKTGYKGYDILSYNGDLVMAIFFNLTRETIVMKAMILYLRRETLW